MTLPTPGQNPNWGAQLNAHITRLDTREYDVRSWFPSGTPTGTSADTAYINEAISDLYDLGGWPTLVFPPTPTGYGIDRVDSAPNPQLSGIMPKPRVSLHSLGATFHMRDNTCFMFAESEIAATLTITANVAVGATTFTVNTTTGVEEGQVAQIRLGTRVGDEAEPLWWSWAKVVSVGVGTVTLDIPAARAATVGSISEAHNKRILIFDEVIENVAYTGLWNLQNDMAPGSDAESGLSIRYCRNVRMDQVVGVNVGAGAITTQFCSGVDIRSIDVPECAAQGGHTAKGRVLSFAESDSVHVGIVRIGHAVGSTLCMVEHLSSGVLIDILEFTNTEGDRASDSIIHMAFDAKCRVGHLISRGYPGAIHSGDNGIKIDHLDIDWTALPTGFGFDAQAVTGYITYDGITYGPKQTVQVPIAVTSSMPGVIPILTGNGIFAGLWVQIADTTNVGGNGDWGLQSTGVGGATNINPGALTPGEPTFIGTSSIHGAIGSYGASSITTPKQVYMYTNTPVDAGNYAVFTYDFFAPYGERQALVWAP